MHVHSGTGYCLYLYEWGLFRCISKARDSHWTLIPWGSLVGLFSLSSLVVISSLFFFFYFSSSLLLLSLLLVLVFLFSYMYKKTEIKFYIYGCLLLFKSLHSCPTLCDPHRRRPTRLPHPWDSPGKNAGVGCHFLFQFVKVKSESEVTQSCPTCNDPMDCSPPGSSVHGIF